MSRLLAACTGATVGYVVGWLAGQSTRDALALRSLSRPGAPQPSSGGLETPGAGNGAQGGTQRCGDLHPTTWARLCIRRPGHDGPHMSDHWQDEPWTDDDSEVDA